MREISNAIAEIARETRDSGRKIGNSLKNLKNRLNSTR